MSESPQTGRIGPVGWLAVAFVLYCVILATANFFYAPEGNLSLGKYLAIRVLRRFDNHLVRERSVGRRRHLLLLFAVPRSAEFADSSESSVSD